MRAELTQNLTQLLHPDTQAAVQSNTQSWVPSHPGTQFSPHTQTQTQDLNAMNTRFQAPKFGKPLSKSARILLGAGIGAGVVLAWHTWTTMNVTLAKLLIAGTAGGGLVALVTVNAGQYRVVQRDPEQTEDDLLNLIQQLRQPEPQMPPTGYAPLASVPQQSLPPNPTQQPIEPGETDPLTVPVRYRNTRPLHQQSVPELPDEEEQLILAGEFPEEADDDDRLYSANGRGH